MISRFLIGSMACTLLASLSSAQTQPCVAQNAGNNISSGAVSAFSFAGANGYGWQFTPAQPLLLFSAEVYTESAFLTGQGYMTLEVWDTNAIFQPGQRLGGGSFEVSAALGHEWHGANFDQPVLLNGGQTYWMVWWEPGGSELPYEPGGNPTTTVRWQGGMWVTQANSEAAKWRAYCGLLDQANVTPVGFGCVASTSTLPAMFTNQAATVGNADFQLEAGGFAPGSFGLLILGTDPNFVSFQIPGATGCQLYTDPLSMLAVTTGTGNQTAGHLPAGPGFAGHCAFDFPIPNNPALSGMFISSQFAMLDLAIGTPLPAVFSNGLNLVLQ